MLPSIAPIPPVTDTGVSSPQQTVATTPLNVAQSLALSICSHLSPIGDWALISNGTRSTAVTTLQFHTWRTTPLSQSKTTSIALVERVCSLLREEYAGATIRFRKAFLPPLTPYPSIHVPNLTNYRITITV